MPCRKRIILTKKMKQLDKKAIWLFFCYFVPFFFLMSFGLYLLIKGVGDLFLRLEIRFGFLGFGMTVLAVFFLSFVWALLSYRFYKYEMAGTEFRKESGVLLKMYTSVPYHKIQNVNIHRGIFSRIFGLSTLYIQTAGTGAAESMLPGLSQKDAEILREDIIHRAKNTKNQTRVDF